MDNVKRIEEIKEEIEELKEKLNDFSKDFLTDYTYNNACEFGTYIEDSMTEYADEHVNIYYSDIDEYFNNHIQESSDALKEYGYTLNDFDDLQDACRKGAQLAQYQELYTELSEDLEILEEIKELFDELEGLENE